MLPSVARCDSPPSNWWSAKEKIPDQPTWLTAETAKPFVGGVTFGSATGFVSGIACKSIGKGVGVVVGTLYMIFQASAYYGYVKMDWKKVEEDLVHAFDMNGDGVIDQQDAKAWTAGALRILSTDGDSNTAAKTGASGSFVAGFMYGLRRK